MINLLRMNKKISLLALIGLVLIPQLVLADMITPLSEVTFPLIPVITLIEAFIFWLFINKIFKVQVGFWKSLLITFVANIVTSLIGTFIPFENPFIYESHVVDALPPTTTGLIIIISRIAWGIIFILTVLIEWVVYIIMLKKTTARKIDLLKISFVANFVTYALILISLVL